jgi:hypothetical protein
MKPTHIIEGNLLDPESTDLNVNLITEYHVIKNIITETTKMFYQISGYHGLPKLTYKSLRVTLQSH